MAIDTDKNSYTIIFAVIMVVVVGSLLAGFASGLKPTIKENEQREKQQNILYAMGINNNDPEDSSVAFIQEDVEATFNEYITKQFTTSFKLNQTQTGVDTIGFIGIGQEIQYVDVDTLTSLVVKRVNTIYVHKSVDRENDD